MSDGAGRDGDPGDQPTTASCRCDLLPISLRIPRGNGTFANIHFTWDATEGLDAAKECAEVLCRENHAAGGESTCLQVAEAIIKQKQDFLSKFQESTKVSEVLQVITIDFTFRNKRVIDRLVWNLSDDDSLVAEVAEAWCSDMELPREYAAAYAHQVVAAIAKLRIAAPAFSSDLGDRPHGDVVRYCDEAQAWAPKIVELPYTTPTGTPRCSSAAGGGGTPFAQQVAIQSPQVPQAQQQQQQQALPGQAPMPPSSLPAPAGSQKPPRKRQAPRGPSAKRQKTQTGAKAAKGTQQPQAAPVSASGAQIGPGPNQAPQQQQQQQKKKTNAAVLPGAVTPEEVKVLGQVLMAKPGSGSIDGMEPELVQAVKEQLLKFARDRGIDLRQLEQQHIQFLAQGLRVVRSHIANTRK